MKKIPCLILVLLVSCTGARTDVYDRGGIFDGGTDAAVEERENMPPEALCPEETYASPTKPAVLAGSGTDDKWIAGYLWEIESAPDESNASPFPEDSATTSLRPDKAGTGDAPAMYTLRLTVTDNEGLTDSCTTLVKAVEGPPVAICPEDESVVAGGEVVLEGDAFDDGYLVSYLWEIVSGPEDYESYLVDFNDKTATFVSSENDSGIFTVRLTVTDDEGLQDACEVQVSVGGVPTAICPEDMVIPTRTDQLLEGNAEDDGTIVGWLWECITHDTDTNPTIVSPEAQNTNFWALRVGHYNMQLTVTDDFGLTDSCTFMITTTETGPTAICPETVETTPLTVVRFTGGGEVDGEIVEYYWGLVSVPIGSMAEPPSPSNAQTATFMPDVAGEYTIRLTVTDDNRNAAFCEFKVIASSGEGLRIEIYWNPPRNPSDPSDVDVHLLHPDADRWFHESLDCYYANCDSRFHVLDWDEPGTDDNPRLDLDEVDGYGPENINIFAPVTGQAYRVGLHFYDAEDLINWRTAHAYVKVYCGEISTEPVYEVGPRALNADEDGFCTDSMYFWECNDFWRVADITWGGFSCSIDPIDDIILAREAESHR